MRVLCIVSVTARSHASLFSTGLHGRVPTGFGEGWPPRSRRRLLRSAPSRNANETRYIPGGIA